MFPSCPLLAQCSKACFSSRLRCTSKCVILLSTYWRKIVPLMTFDSLSHYFWGILAPSRSNRARKRKNKEMNIKHLLRLLSRSDSPGDEVSNEMLLSCLAINKVEGNQLEDNRTTTTATIVIHLEMLQVSSQIVFRPIVSVDRKGLLGVNGASCCVLLKSTLIHPYPSIHPFDHPSIHQSTLEPHSHTVRMLVWQISVDSKSEPNGIVFQSFHFQSYKIFDQPC